MAKKQTSKRADGVAVNFRMTDAESASILTLIAFHQRASGKKKLSKASMAKEGLLREGVRLQKIYAADLPKDFVPIKL